MMSGPVLLGEQCQTAETPPALDALELLYGTLFQPVRTFQEVARLSETDRRPFLQSLAVVMLISAMAPMIALGSLGGDPTDLAWTIPLSVIGGLMAWGVMGGLISLFSYAFTKQSCLRTFMTLSGLATLPWLIAAPVSMLRIGLGAPGFVLFVLLSLLVWLWSVLLFGLALMQSFRMSVARALIVLAAPFAMSVIMLAWIVGFLENIGRLAAP